MALIAAGMATMLFWGSSGVAFDPAKGETRDYRVGVVAHVREGDDPPNAYNSQSLVMQSVMRYRVDADGPTLKMHVQPRFIDVEDGDGAQMFSSANRDKLRGTPVIDLMSDGFDLIMDRKSGDTRLNAVNQNAWNEFTERLGSTQTDQFKQQMAAPSLTRELPAREGAQITVDAFQGMPALTLTVDTVTDDIVTVTLERADDADSAYTPVGGSDNNARMRVTAVHGRMRVDRDGGWIDAMTLISDQDVQTDGQKGHMHTIMTMHAVDDPALGSLANGLDQLRATAHISPQSDEVELPLAHRPSEADRGRGFNPAKTPYADADPSFSIDEADNALVLTLAHDIGIDENLGMSTLKSLTLRDADGQTLDIPMVLESIGPDYAKGSMNTIVRLLPMGWQDAGLDRITEVEAQLDYAAPAEPEHVEIPLADTPTELHDGAAQARAVPTDDGWRLFLSGTEQTFYIFDSSAVFARDLSARISQTAHDGLTPSDRTLLARVDVPDAWVQQILVEGRGDAFGLKLYKNMPGPSTHDVTFTSRQQRYSNRELPPPETRELYIDEIPDDASLSLDDVAPEGADENQLNMRLPIGVGSACELSADAPAESGHALVWRPDDERASGFGIGSRRAGEHPDTAPWQLMTDDGVRVYFYGIDVTTTLRCPGQPAWQTHEVNTDSDKPWLVDLDAVIDGPIDRGQQAKRFFDSHRFLDGSGELVRPMLKDMTPDTQLDDWRVEGANHTVADYLDDAGRIRFWGRIARVKSVTFSGEPIEKRWHTHLEGLQ
ncbi:hypothetical protein SAOR_01975 [Salinisphaera orenii MK-B5]|uniref:Uncharacterized protein n=1 Tax=Salinisphaera orenii MK-B5 TaxID=856730 RepID=A0A423PWH0_9GAMM|nr:hypothetical protein SAOR_01975 [Salinisphaera orenii MK-B5]